MDSTKRGETKRNLGQVVPERSEGATGIDGCNHKQSREVTMSGGASTSCHELSAAAGAPASGSNHELCGAVTSTKP